jgi:formate-dependent nitrite reductase cytochrome c552 subunit
MTFSFQVPETETRCWDWSRGKTGRGYGAFYLGKKQIRAHRFMWIHILQREAPKGMHLHHKCGNHACVNPAHLELLTAKAHAGYHNTKTVCSHGHAFTPENTIWHKTKRECRACHNRNVREFARKKYATNSAWSKAKNERNRLNKLKKKSSNLRPTTSWLGFGGAMLKTGWNGKRSDD